MRLSHAILRWGSGLVVMAVALMIYPWAAWVHNGNTLSEWFTKTQLVLPIGAFIVATLALPGAAANARQTWGRLAAAVCMLMCWGVLYQIALEA